MADLALGLILAVSREAPPRRRYVRAADSGADGPYRLTRKVSGARLGIFGLGRIGRAIAQRAEGFGMRIAYTDRSEIEGVKYTFFPTARGDGRAGGLLRRQRLWRARDARADRC